MYAVPATPSVVHKVPNGPDNHWLNSTERGEDRDPFRFLLDLVEEFGDIVHYRTAYGPVYFFNHPDQIKEVLHNANFERTTLPTLALGQGLLSSDGDYWRSQRRVMQPHFHESCLIGFAPLMGEVIADTIERWENFAASGDALDMSLEMRYLTIDVITRAMFSIELSEVTDELCDAITVVVEHLGYISCTMLNLPMKFSAEANQRFQAAVKAIDQFAYGLIENRRNSEAQPHDLLAMLMATQDKESGEALTDRQLRDEVVTLLIAGHETTGIILAWTWHLLSENPDVLTKLETEIDEVLGKRFPTADDLPQLKYCEMVFSEAMRLYPPVWFMMRNANEPDEIAGYKIPAKAFVLVSPYTTHRHPQFWEDPESFKPERFAADLIKQRPLYAHFPFAGGRHFCLGQRFAMIEGQLVLAAITQRFRLKTVSGHPLPMQPVLTLRQQFGLPMTVEKRI
jgi:cytochrome P450